MQVVVQGLLINYDLKGRGKLVLLLHGWGDSLRTFEALGSGLKAKYKVLSVDLPGFGTSQPPPRAWTLDDYGLFIRQLLTKLELPQPYAIVGHSNGGALAIRALSKKELKAERLVLIAASGIRNTQRLKKLIYKIIAKVGKVATFWLPAEYRQALRRRLYGTIGSDMLVTKHMQETFRQTVRQDVQADAAKLDLPTLLIYGDRDPAVPFSDGQRYNRLIKNSELKTLNSSDHFLHHDQPKAIAEAIKEFLR